MKQEINVPKPDGVVFHFIVVFVSEATFKWTSLLMIEG